MVDRFKRFGVAVAGSVMLCAAVHAAPVAKPRAVFADAALEFREVPLREFAAVVYREVAKVPYVLDSGFVAYAGVISMDVRGKSSAVVRDFLRAQLDAAGFVEREVAGVVRVMLKTIERPEREVYVYRPRFRAVSYLVDLASMLVRGEYLSQRAVDGSAQAPGTTAAPASESDSSAFAKIDKGADVLVYVGAAADVKRLDSLVRQLDTPAGEVLVRGAIYEVRVDKRDASAISLLASILEGKLGVTLGSATVAERFADRLSFKVGNFDGVLAVLGQDSRFKSVSSPQLRVRSGDTASVEVGAEVPVLGALTTRVTGETAQSIQYRASGVILKLSPQVRRDVVSLNVSQEVSSFIATQTSVINSPTLLKRSVQTVVDLVPGEFVVLGGLEQTGRTDDESGASFLPKWLRARGSRDEQTELIVLLGVQAL